MIHRVEIQRKPKWSDAIEALTYMGLGAMFTLMAYVTVFWIQYPDVVAKAVRYPEVIRALSIEVTAQTKEADLTK